MWYYENIDANATKQEIIDTINSSRRCLYRLHPLKNYNLDELKKATKVERAHIKMLSSEYRYYINNLK